MARCRAAGLTLSPTFVAFTPWTTLDGYAEFLDDVEALDLVEHVAPVQWTIRLLVTLALAAARAATTCGAGRARSTRRR